MEDFFYLIFAKKSDFKKKSKSAFVCYSCKLGITKCYNIWGNFHLLRERSCANTIILRNMIDLVRLNT